MSSIDGQDDDAVAVDASDDDLLDALAEELPQDEVDPRQRRQHKERKAKKKNIGNARKTLLFVVFGLALLTMVFLTISLFNPSAPNLIETAAYACLTGLFVGLYAWARRKPYQALLCGIIVFAGLWVLDVVAALLTDPGSAINGVLPRTIILVLLIRGFLAAKDLRSKSAAPSD